MNYFFGNVNLNGADEKNNQLSEKDIKYYVKRLQQLRDKAEATLAQAPAVEASPCITPAPTTADELLHELQVHQIELEMQNEQLRRRHVALEESSDRYVDLYEFAPVGHLTLTQDGLISAINLTGATLLGVERKKLLQCPFSRFVTAGDSDRWHHMLQGLIHNEKWQSFELALKYADGSAFHTRLDCQLIEVEGESLTIQIALINIPERRQIERRHIESELRIAATVFESQVGMFITDAKEVILRVNQAFTNITGYTAEEAVGQTPRLLNSGRHDAAFYTVMWESISRTGAWHGEIWNHRKSGEEYPEFLTITAVADNYGLVTNYVATLTDSTKYKQREQQRLSEESAHRDALVREVHHRIKNNLQGVTGILRNFAALHPEFTDPITTAVSQVQSIAVFYGLQGHVAQAKVRLCELTSAIATNNESLWQTPIAVDIPPQWVPSRITETEAVPLALVLNELISNAVKHGDRTKGVSITLRHEPLPYMVQVTITNLGQLPPDFDFPYHPTTGAGLQLIASLLPRTSATLSWQRQDDNVIVRLELAPPIITLEQEEMEIL